MVYARVSILLCYTRGIGNANLTGGYFISFVVEYINLIVELFQFLFIFGSKGQSSQVFQIMYWKYPDDDLRRFSIKVAISLKDIVFFQAWLKNFWNLVQQNFEFEKKN